MKAPTDKTNDTIQIVVTTACDIFNCSNCTQLLPFRRDYRHMSVDVFREALRSLGGWSGIRGIFGGNPCVHPRFEDLMQILVEEVPNQKHRGIWTNNLCGHGPLVREVFYPNGRFNLNAHARELVAVNINKHLPGKLIRTSRNRYSWHSPILLNWTDLGVSKEEWIALREQCDLNLHWSAAILERDGKPYAYFCEVAGALDGIRGENNGILAEPGWWCWKMDRFANQVEMCCDRGCGIPLNRLGHREDAFVYDISASFGEICRSCKTAKKVKIEEHSSMPEDGTEKPTDYQALRSRKP